MNNILKALIAITTLTALFYLYDVTTAREGRSSVEYNTYRIDM